MQPILKKNQENTKTHAVTQCTAHSRTWEVKTGETKKLHGCEWPWVS